MSTLGRRTTLVTALVLVAALVVPASATAAPTWLPAQRLSGDTNGVRDLDVATDDAGNSVAVWSADGLFGGGLVRAATRPAGGTWSAAVTLDRTFQQHGVSVAIDGAGVATAVWNTDLYVDGVGVVRAARLPSPTGVWTAPRTVSEPDVYSSEPSVAVDDAGDAVATWLTLSTAPWQVRAAFRPAGGGWQPPAPVSTSGGDAREPAVILDDAGTATAVWWVDDAVDRVQASVRPLSGSWSQPVDLSAADDSGHNPRLAGGATGTATAVWEAHIGTDDADVIQSSLLSGGAWSRPVTISDGSGRYQPTIAVNDSGQAVAGWDDEDDTDGTQVARRAPDGTWGPAIRLDADVPAYRAAVAIDDAGVATAVWRRNDDQTLRWARQALGGEWSQPVDIPGGGSPGEPLVVSGADGDGDVVLAWQSDLSPAPHVRVAGLDAAGPRVHAFAAPSVAGVGEGLDFSAEAADDWSAVASYSWSFGDGTSAAGPWVTHAYPAAGTYPVTLTVTDTLGNTTSRSTSVAVGAAVTPVTRSGPPKLTKFQLTHRRIKALAGLASRVTRARTRLNIALTAAAQVRLVVRSEHRHLVAGRLKHVHVTLTRRRPAGPSTITLRNRLATIRLPADTYRIVGLATNKTGTSRKRTARLVVTPVHQRSGAHSPPSRH